MIFSYLSNKDDIESPDFIQDSPYGLIQPVKLSKPSTPIEPFKGFNLKDRLHLDQCSEYGISNSSHEIQTGVSIHRTPKRNTLLNLNMSMSFNIHDEQPHLEATESNFNEVARENRVRKVSESLLASKLLGRSTKDLDSHRKNER